MKKRPSFVSTKQRVVAVFTVTMMLLQICLPTVAWAASLLSNESISAAMSTQAFRKSSSNSHLYEQATFDDASDVGSQNIKTFRERLVAAKTNLGKPTFVPIGSDITIFVPTYPTGKLIGDAYVQNRYIRQQVFDLLGRHLIYASSDNTSEVSQINTLYDNAFTFAKANPTLNFGANLSSTTLANLATDMIWPEVRVINNESVVVPILYLTASTINGNKVTKTTTEFTGAAASIGSITLDHSTLTLGAKTMLSTKNGITLGNDALIKSDGDINLAVGGTLNLIGSKITGAKDVNIIAKEVNIKSVVIPFQDRYGSGTKLGSVSSVNSSTGNIFIRSTGGDITFEGSTATASNGSITLDSAKNISIQPVFLSYQGDGSYGAWIIDKSSVNIVGSKLSARDTISLYAEGAITITSSQLRSTQGGIELLAQQGIYVLDEQGNTQVSRQKIKGRTQGTSSEFNTWAVRSVLSAGKGVLMDTAEGDITLRAAQISSTEGTGVYARNGKVHLLVTKEQSQYYLNMVKKGTWTIKTRTVEQNNETAVPNSIVGGFAVEALQGVDVEYTGLVDTNGKPIEDLDTQMDVYKTMPELAWMAELRNNPDVSTAWNQVKLIKINKDKTSRQLSPAAMAVIAIAVAVATGGGGAALLSGSSITGAAAGTTWAAVSNAAFTTLVTQASSSILAGNSLSQTLKNMSSEDSLKSLAISMVTAGAMQNTQLEMFKVAENAPTTAITLAQQAGQAVVNATVQAGVSVAISGGNSEAYKKAFTQALASDAINSIGQKITTKITNSTSLTDASKYITHAALGCLSASVTSKLNDTDVEPACLSSAAGAVIGQALTAKADKLQSELTAWESDLYKGGTQVKLSQMNEKINYFRSQGIDLSRLIAGMAAFAFGGDVNAAASGAVTVAKSNMARAVDTAKLLREINGDRDYGLPTFAKNQTALAEDEMIEGLKQAKVPQSDIDAMVEKARANNIFKNVGDFYASYYDNGKNIDKLMDQRHPSTTAVNTGSDGAEWIKINPLSPFQYAVIGFNGGTQRFLDSLTEDQRKYSSYGLQAVTGGVFKLGLNLIIQKGVETIMPQEMASTLSDINEYVSTSVGTAGAGFLYEQEWADSKNRYEDNLDPSYINVADESDYKDVVKGTSWLVTNVLGVGDLRPRSPTIKILDDDTKFGVSAGFTDKTPGQAVKPNKSGIVCKTKVKNASCDIDVVTADEKRLLGQIRNRQDTDGKLTEQLTKITAERQGYEELHGQYNGSGHGIDHILIKRGSDGKVTEMIIVDSKQLTNGAFELGNTNNGFQLSENWIRNAANQLKDDNPVKKDLQNAILNKTYSTAVTAVDKTTGKFLFIPVNVP